jgi:hypothetical protein
MPLFTKGGACHAAAQQTQARHSVPLTGSLSMTTDTELPCRTEPAKVYPSPGSQDRWIVEAPGEARQTARQPVLFSGPNAVNQALRYAYEEFGSARFFPF